MNQAINVALVGFDDVWMETFLTLLASHYPSLGGLSLVTQNPTTEDPIYRFAHQSLMPQPINNFDFSQVDVAIFTEPTLASDYIDTAKQQCQILDLTGQALAADPTVPLLIPGVLTPDSSQGIWALPDSVSLPLLMTVIPIDQAVGLDSINVVTCESVSGCGQSGLYELAQQSAALLGGKPFQSQQFNRQMAFNIIPEINQFDEYGSSDSERSVNYFLHKALGRDNITTAVTSMRIPVFYGNTLTVHVTTEQPFSAKACSDELAKIPGLVVRDQAQHYPTPVSDASGKDSVFVGRLRQPQNAANQLAFWAVSDNLRQGIGLNIINALQYIQSIN